MDFDLARSVQVLSRTPAALASLLGGLDQEWTDSNEGGDSWSPFNVVGHLIDGERTDWIPRARIILDREGRPFTPFNRFTHLEATRGKSLAELLDTFATLRRDNLATLASWNLAAADLDLPGFHPELGPVTLRQLLATWVVHDLNHVGQVSRIMARQYASQVGPWKAYLPIIQ